MRLLDSGGYSQIADFNACVKPPHSMVVPETGIEPVRPLFTKAADFKSAVSTNFTTQASVDNAIL